MTFENGREKGSKRLKAHVRNRIFPIKSSPYDPRLLKSYVKENLRAFGVLQ